MNLENRTKSLHETILLIKQSRMPFNRYVDYFCKEQKSYSSCLAFRILGAEYKNFSRVVRI